MYYFIFFSLSVLLKLLKHIKLIVFEDPKENTINEKPKDNSINEDPQEFQDPQWI